MVVYVENSFLVKKGVLTRKKKGFTKKIYFPNLNTFAILKLMQTLINKGVGGCF